DATAVPAMPSRPASRSAALFNSIPLPMSCSCWLFSVRRSVQSAALLVFFPAAAGAGVVALRGRVAADRRARGQRFHAMVVEIGHHRRDLDHDAQTLAVVDGH